MGRPRLGRLLEIDPPTSDVAVLDQLHTQGWQQSPHVLDLDSAGFDLPTRDVAVLDQLHTQGWHQPPHVLDWDGEFDLT